MVNKISLIVGDVEKGKFRQVPNGKFYEVVIEFDNGSSRSHCVKENVQREIETSIARFENMPNRSQY